VGTLKDLEQLKAQGATGASLPSTNVSSLVSRKFDASRCLSNIKKITHHLEQKGAEVEPLLYELISTDVYIQDVLNEKRKSMNMAPIDFSLQYQPAEYKVLGISKDVILDALEHIKVDDLEAWIYN